MADNSIRNKKAPEQNRNNEASATYRKSNKNWKIETEVRKE